MTTPRKRPQSRKKAEKATLDMSKIVKSFALFRDAKRLEDQAKRTHEEQRDKVLMPAVVAFGHAHGEKGQHLAIDLPEEIDGFTRLVRRTKATPMLNIDRAEQTAEKRGFLPEVQVTTVTITGVPGEKAAEVAELLEKAGLGEYGLVQVDTRFSQERLYAFHQKHREPAKRGDKRYLTEEEMDSFIDTDVSYAFHPERST